MTSFTRHSDALRAAIARGPVVAPGVNDAMSARLATEAGFTSTYLGGACCGATRGYPDMSVLSLTELVDAARVIVRASGTDLIVDIDTGYGGVAAVQHSIRSMEEAGVAAVHIEDQPFPKRCGYMVTEECIPVEEMLVRIEASRRAAEGMMIVARTDALLSSGLDDAIVRSRAYREAGADAIFVNGVKEIGELRALADGIQAPLLYNVSGSDQAPPLRAADAAQYGVDMIVYPLQATRAALAAERQWLQTLAQDEDPGTDGLLGFREYFRLAGWNAAEEFEDALRLDVGQRNG